MALGAHIDASQALANALDGLIYFGPADDPHDFYQLFLNAPEWDYELGGSYGSPRWLRVCPDSKCFQLILRSQGHELRPWAVEDRFALLIRNQRIRCAQFLDCIGLAQSDHGLANLKTDTAFTVLHYVVRRLRARAYDDQDWLNLGRSLIMNGADPSAITLGDDGRTPLGNMRLDLDEAPSVWLTRLRLWIRMLQETDVDLENYGAKENQRWIPFFTDGSSDCLIEGLIYGPTPADWSLVVSWRRTLYTFGLLHTPGTFNISHHVPDKICWLPGPAEEVEEGHWYLIGACRAVSSTMNLQDCFTETEEHYLQLCRSSQDDSGTIMLLQDRASRRAPRPRSYSQPPCLRRREADYCALRRVASWMSRVHFCPFGSHWSCDCSGGYFPYSDEALCESETHTLSDLRRCMNGTHRVHGSVQESPLWLNHSFLAEIADCQSENPNSAGQSWVEAPFWNVGVSSGLQESRLGQAGCSAGALAVSSDPVNSVT